MKKIIGILGVLALSLSMFLSGNTIANTPGELSLNSLISLNPAEACTESSTSSANAACTASGMCRYDTTARDCHL